MAMPEWMRKLGKFLPNYGRCGGYSAPCDYPETIDEMDKLFRDHDRYLQAANYQSDPIMKARIREEADVLLGIGLRHIDPKKLSMYGRLYRTMAMTVFRA